MGHLRMWVHSEKIQCMSWEGALGRHRRQVFWHLDLELAASRLKWLTVDYKPWAPGLGQSCQPSTLTTGLRVPRANTEASKGPCRGGRSGPVPTFSLPLAPGPTAPRAVQMARVMPKGSQPQHGG
jgi:hypothetical protein